MPVILAIAKSYLQNTKEKRVIDINTCQSVFFHPFFIGALYFLAVFVEFTPQLM